MKNILIQMLRLFPRLWNRLYLKKYNVEFDKNPLINGCINFMGHGRYILGNNVKIRSTFTDNPTAGGYITSLNSFDGAILKIGNNVGISHSAISAMESVEIGDNVLIGSNCMITDTDFHPIDVKNRIANERAEIKTSPVKIENNVFIGARSIILKGVTIGENSVVGAGSVVTKNIPANEIWAGNPAKFIKKV